MTTRRFDLLVEPWIPVLTPDGAETELGLTEVLVQAHEIRDLSAASPLVGVAVCRLLLAVLHRVFGPADEREWERLWRQRRFDPERLRPYFRAHAERFDLFHPQRPFYQTPGLPERLAGSVRRLAAEEAAGHQATLFDHHCDGDESAVPAARAARWLVAHQSYCLSGSVSNGTRLQGVPAGPLAHLAVFLLTGDNLFETLMLNLTPYDPAQHVPLPCPREDLPAWERDPAREDTADPGGSGSHADDGPAGYLDVLTWQTRSVLLLPGGAGTPACRKAIIMPGRQYPLSRLSCEPMGLYFAHPRLPGQWQSLRVAPERVWWQDLATVLKPSSPRRRRPLTLEALARRVATGIVPAGVALQLTICGLAGEKARVDLWRREQCRLPVAYLHDEDLLGDLELALQLAATTQRILSAHVWQLAQRLSFASPSDDAGRPLGPPAAGRPGRSLWARLQLPLRRLIERLPGSVEERSVTLAWWGRVCGQTAWHVWHETVDRADPRARVRRWEGVLAGQMARQLRREVLAPWEGIVSEAV
jgi:CRISPR system Cascade subunit CasA